MTIHPPAPSTPCAATRACPAWSKSWASMSTGSSRKAAAWPSVDGRRLRRGLGGHDPATTTSYRSRSESSALGSGLSDAESAALTSVAQPTPFLGSRRQDRVLLEQRRVQMATQS